MMVRRAVNRRMTPAITAKPIFQKVMRCSAWCLTETDPGTVYDSDSLTVIKTSPTSHKNGGQVGLDYFSGFVGGIRWCSPAFAAAYGGVFPCPCGCLRLLSAPSVKGYGGWN
jgi:hypothetical protein